MRWRWGRATIFLILLVSIGVFVLAPVVPIVVPCVKGGDGTLGYRFEGMQSPGYALFGVGVSTAPRVDCYIP